MLSLTDLKRYNTENHKKLSMYCVRRRFFYEIEKGKYKDIGLDFFFSQKDSYAEILKSFEYCIRLHRDSLVQIRLFKIDSIVNDDVVYKEIKMFSSF